MTVEQVGKTSMTDEDGVWCVWFEKIGNKQVVQRETFPPVALKNTNAPPPDRLRCTEPNHDPRSVYWNQQTS